MGEFRPPEIKSATGKTKSVAITALLNNFGIGGATWMTHFAVDYPLSGDLSHDGVRRRDTSVTPGPPRRGDMAKLQIPLRAAPQSLRVLAWGKRANR